jgi:hypothetical protein
VEFLEIDVFVRVHGISDRAANETAVGWNSAGGVGPGVAASARLRRIERDSGGWTICLHYWQFALLVGLCEMSLQPTASCTYL